MNLNDFQEYMRKKGYKMIGRAACGVENGYPVTVSYFTGKTWKVVFTVGLENWKLYQKELGNALKENGGASAMMEENHLAITIKVNEENYKTSYQSAVDRTISILKQNNVHPITNCGFCNQGNCDSLVYHNGWYQPVHNTCCKQLVETVKGKMEANDANGNYFLGLIGALLGTVIGIIPMILSIYFTDTIYSVLVALVPICIYYGYKLFKGKMNMAALGITVVLSFISVYLIQIVLTIVLVMTERGFELGESIELMKTYLATADSWVEITKESVTLFVFTALGIWISWKYIANTNRGMVASIEEQMSTITEHRPNNMDNFNM